DVSTSLANIGNSCNGTMTVDGTGSTFTNSGTTNIGNNTNSAGTVTFQNTSGGSFATLNLGTIAASTNSFGSMTVQSNADVTDSGNIAMGTGGSTGQSGAITVTGSG